MKKGKTHVASATKVRQFLSEPYAIYCDKFVDKGQKDPQNDYQDMLSERGKQHENQYSSTKYPSISPLAFQTLEEGFKQTLNEMTKKKKAILNAPLFYLPDGMRGVADILERKKGTSLFGSHHYVVKEVKLAKNIKKGHEMQGAFYNYLIGKIQGRTPDIFHVINRDGEQSNLYFDDYKDDLNGALEGIQKILNGQTITPTYNSCKWPWEEYCNEQAIKSKDISLVNDVGLSLKQSLVDYGLTKIKHLISCTESELCNLRGIGPAKSKNIKHHAKALVNNRCYRKTSDKLNLPRATTEIFLDLEGTDPNATHEGGELIQMDFLIGIIVRKNGIIQGYTPLVADGHDKEEEMLRKFLKFIRKQKNYVIYHWHHYEKIHLTKMMDKYSIDNKTQNLVINKLIDLHKEATSRYAFPTYGNSIKTIAKWMKFKWRHKDVNALQSIVMYLDYLKDPKSKQDVLKRIQDYNEDDCKATLIIKDWLIKKNNQSI